MISNRDPQNSKCQRSSLDSLFQGELKKNKIVKATKNKIKTNSKCDLKVRSLNHGIQASTLRG